MPKFMMTELVNSNTFTARLGAGTGAANVLNDISERGKAVKLGGDSRYVLAAFGDELEGVIDSINTATSDGYSVGAVRDHVGSGKFLKVTFDGVQVSPGVGAVVVGDYVLVGSVVAKDTALTEPLRVTKATSQANAKATPFAWRVVSLGLMGTGAVGTIGIVQRVGA